MVLHHRLYFYPLIYVLGMFSHLFLNNLKPHFLSPFLADFILQSWLILECCIHHWEILRVTSLLEKKMEKKSFLST